MLTAVWLASGWVQVVVAMSVLVTAAGALWRNVVRPAARAISRTEELAPVLYAIAQEFRPDRGTSLRDVIDRMDDRLGHIEEQLGIERPR